MPSELPAVIAVREPDVKNAIGHSPGRSAKPHPNLFIFMSDAPSSTWLVIKVRVVEEAIKSEP